MATADKAVDLSKKLAAIETQPLEGEIVKAAPDAADIPEGGIPATGRSRRVWEIALSTINESDETRRSSLADYVRGEDDKAE